MKKILIIGLALLSGSVFACQEEALVSMKVIEVETDSMMTCKAIVTNESISFYNESMICPLSKRDVIDYGIDFPLINGHDCEVPEYIHGVLIKTNNRIILD